MSGAACAPVNVRIAFCDIKIPEKITAVTREKSQVDQVVDA
jgi:hypothetical protein